MDDMGGGTVFWHRLEAAAPALTLKVPGAEGLTEAPPYFQTRGPVVSQNHLENVFGGTRGVSQCSGKSLTPRV